MVSTNCVAEVAIDGPSPPLDGPAVTKTRPQRTQATKGNAQGNEFAATAQDTPASSIVTASTNDEKPKEKGWEASLTLAQLKAYKEEQALKAHNKRFPPKPKEDPTTAKTKQAETKAKGRANTNQAHAGLKNAKTTKSGNARSANVARQESTNYNAVLAAP